MTDTYMLMGRRLGHSFSARYFNARFGKEQIDAVYNLCEIPEISILPEVVAACPSLKGFNVTIPYKESIIPYLSTLTPLAKKVGAVNTVAVCRSRDGQPTLIGHNTDVAGFKDSLSTVIREVEGRYGPYPPGSHAMVLGTGGASKAVCEGLRLLGFNPVKISRNVKPDSIPYADITPSQVWDAEVIVNATPAGMFPDINSAPPFPYQYMRNGDRGSRPQIAFDLVYNPADTLFMKICRAHGAVVSNGEAMLHAQAEAAWLFWNSAPQSESGPSQ